MGRVKEAERKEVVPDKGGRWEGYDSIINRRKKPRILKSIFCLRNSNEISQMWAKSLWEINLEDMQTGAGTVRPENQAQDHHLPPQAHHQAGDQHQGNHIL